MAGFLDARAMALNWACYQGLTDTWTAMDSTYRASSSSDSGGRSDIGSGGGDGGGGGGGVD